MAISKVVVGLAVAAGLLVLGSGKSSAATPPKPDPKKTPAERDADFQAELAKAIAENDPAKILEIAGRMKDAGLTLQAGIAATFAMELHARLQARPPGVPPGFVPPGLFPPGVPPGFVPPGFIPPGFVPPLPVDGAKRSKMTALQTHLRNTRRYKEDRIMVKGVQLGEGIGADGMYGAGLATLMGDRYGLIPPVPFYWSKRTWKADKERYKAFLTEKARTDPTRETEWLGAIRGVDKS